MTEAMKWFLLFFLLLLVAGNAHAAGKATDRLPYPCSVVRWAVATFTQEHLEAMAKLHGIVITSHLRQQVAECVRGG
jgi:hypothetical protein